MSQCEITLHMPDFRGAAERIKRELPGLIAATLQTQRGMVFDTSGTYNGRPGWPELRCRDGQPLKDRGTLSQSMGPQNDGVHPGHSVGSIVRLSDGLVTIGTDIAYAAIQNYGGVIVPVRAKALRFMCHGKVVFRKRVRIPARTFNDFTAADVTELEDTVGAYIASVIGGAQ